MDRRLTQLSLFLALTAGSASGQAPGVSFDARTAQSGKWSDAATWSNRRAPKAGDRVQVRPGHAVVYDVDADAALRRLVLAPTLDATSPATALVIETATENLAIKQAIVRDAEARFAPDAVIATNTSALSITEIASAAKAPQRVVGMHFFNPVHKMKLVEVVRGLETTPATVQRARDWAAAIGKTSIEVNEAPGFTTSRISALLGNEAMYMLAEGVASAEDIDTSMRMAFNHPMGPLELGDMTGWDTRLAVLQYLHQTLGEKFRPCPLISKLVKAGRFGRKTGRGIYAYDDQGVKIPHSAVKVF